ncbi:MAG: VaFE repeat-containing surface-anchored protein, partial [Firmicutes bacterium]|nr:VaFE repeat-containing surface-anchored protein [Bacillota bacterium]
MTRYQVEVTESTPADITLPNGKTLTLTVDGSTYSYTYDGQTRQYVPEAAYTGYFAKFVYEEKQEDVNNPKAHSLTFTAAKGTSQLTAETVHEPVMIPNPENPEDPEDMIQKGDDKGNKVFDYFLNVSLDGIDPVILDEGEKTSLKVADGSVYIVEVAKDGNVTVSVSGSLIGATSDAEEPAATVDGVKQTEGLEFVKSVTFARQDSAAKTVQIKINTLDNLTSGEIKNDAKDVPKGPNVPYIPAPSDPTIRTTATDSETNDHISEADKSVTIVDTVTCWNLTVGREYILKGVLMDQATGGQLMIDGKPVTAETRFKATAANGSVDVTFTFDGSELGGKSLVVFEELFLLTDLNGDGTAETETKVAEHQDITDEGQTVLLKAPEEEPTEEPEEDEPEEEPKPTPEEPEEEAPKTNVPKTGDTDNLWLWLILLAAAAFGTAWARKE